MLIVERCGTASLWLDPQEWHCIEPENFCSQIINRTHYVSRNDLLGRTCWIEPIEHRLTRLEVVQVDPPAAFPIDAFYFRGSAPAARFSYFGICVARVD